MPQTPKEKPKDVPDKPDVKRDDLWEKDIEERGYYYDDAHGYKKFDPDDDEDIEAAD